MAVPDYQSAMLPLLELAADGDEHTLGDAIEQIADRFYALWRVDADYFESAWDAGRGQDP